MKLPFRDISLRTVAQKICNKKLSEVKLWTIQFSGWSSYARASQALPPYNPPCGKEMGSTRYGREGNP